MKQTECTTILVGKKATIDGSTMIARSEDGGRVIIPEGFKAVNPEDQPKHYTSKRSTTKIQLQLLFVTPLHLMFQVKTVFGAQLVSTLKTLR